MNNIRKINVNVIVWLHFIWNFDVGPSCPCKTFAGKVWCYSSWWRNLAKAQLKWVNVRLPKSTLKVTKKISSSKGSNIIRADSVSFVSGKPSSSSWIDGLKSLRHNFKVISTGNVQKLDGLCMLCPESHFDLNAYCPSSASYDMLW